MKSRLLSSSILQLVLVLTLQTLVVSSQNIINGSVPVGESLIASETQQFSSSWRSPSGDFAFGFRKIQPNDGFTLSIWFDKISDKTIVWHAQMVNTTTGLVPDGSNVTLTADRGLVLTNPRGQVLWRSLIPQSSGSVSRGIINDVGNFGLLSEDSREFLWSSFANPTDTLLPSQIIEVSGNISSRRTETSFKKGRFRLRLGTDGDLQLLTLNVDTLAETDIDFSYYASNTKDTNPAIRLVFNDSGYMYLLQRDNSTRFDLNKTIPLDSTNFYHRAVLHFYGVFAQYYHPKGVQGSTSGWTLAWSLPDNICQKRFGPNIDANELGNLACGFNSICILDNQRPKCECPERFSLVNPSDEYGDCVPDFKMQTCNQTGNSNVEENYEFIDLAGTNWPSGDYMRYRDYDEESCKDSCLKDCFCGAVVFGRDKVCWKKKFPLSYGIRTQNGDPNVFIKALKPGLSEEELPVKEKRSEEREWLITAFSVLLGASAFVNFVILVLYRKIKKKKPNQDIGSITATDTAMELNLRVFTYKELLKATGEFTEELGRGAFGIVYKGVLKVTDSEINVAVKKLDRIAQESEKEFKNEVKVIGQIHHKNLVKLIGFCNEDLNRLIVYEFLPNGTLATFLFNRPRPSWEERTRIAVAIARGILYLHEECSEQIIHCDIKPQNVLLDEFYNPRISDFGLAKLLMMNQTHTLTNIRGTKGYVAPEWFRNSPITSKVDVYSFGVMLLEIVCCKKAVDFEDDVILIDWAYDCFRQRRLVELVKDDLEAMEEMESVERYVRIGIWCIQEEAGMRPSMRNVTQMLEGVCQVPLPPNPSPYSFFTCDQSMSNSHVLVSSV